MSRITNLSISFSPFIIPDFVYLEIKRSFFNIIRKSLQIKKCTIYTFQFLSGFNIVSLSISKSLDKTLWAEDLLSHNEKLRKMWVQLMGI